MIPMKENTYEDYLESCIKKSMNAFEQARRDAIYRISHTDYCEACGTGTMLMMEYIDQITKHATRIRTYEHALREYKEKIKG